MRAEPDSVRILMLNRGAADCAPAEITLDPDLLAANLVCGFEQMSQSAHPFFTIRSQLLRIARASGMRVIAVTSTQPCNGKTHVSVNLAAAISHIHPTILVELDLRRPSVGERLGVPAWLPGIDDFLNNEAGFLASSIRVKGFNLCVHRVRQISGRADALLASPALKSFFDGIRKADGAPICIVDTPPTIVQDDLSRIAAVIDGVILVIEEGETSKALVREAEATLGSTPIIGTILNKSLTAARARGSYGYDYYADLPAGS